MVQIEKLDKFDCMKCGEGTLVKRLNNFLFLFDLEKVWQIITGHEKQIYYENKYEENKGLDAEHLLTSQCKWKPIGGEILFCIWYDSKGIDFIMNYWNLYRVNKSAASN